MALPSRSAFCRIAAGFTLLAPGLRAQDALITPSAITSSTAVSDFYPVVNLINGSGLSGTPTLAALGTHSPTDTTTAWVTTGNYPADYFTILPAPVLTCTLPSVQMVSELVIWGYGGNPNEAKSFTLTFSTDGTNFGNAATVTQPTLLATAGARLAFSGGARRATHVRVQITDNHHTPAMIGDRVGLGELKFTGQPPPPIVVTSNANTGTGSLRAALAAAAAQSGPDTITFAPALNGATISPTTADDAGSFFNITGTNNVTIDASALSAGVTLNGGLQGKRFFYVAPTASLTLRGLTLANGGGASDRGGAILNDGTLTLTRCTLTGNRANSTTPGNGNGGAIGNGGTAFLTHCTLSGNTASFSGGAINSGGPITLTHCSISGNHSTSGPGGGFHSQSTTDIITLSNTVIAGNTTGGSNLDLSNPAGPAATLTGVNLIGDLTGSGLAASGALLTGSPLLAPLGSNGGPTQTMAPLPGSPVIDATSGSTATTDQRGVPVIGVPDIGACESSLADALTVSSTASSGPGSLRKVLTSAAAYPGADTITFAPALSGVTISLASTIDITDAAGVTIDAASLPGGLTIDDGAAASYSLFSIGSGSIVTFHSLTFANGGRPGAVGMGNAGGAILNQYGTLSLTRCTLRGNEAAEGGAIYSNTSSDFTSSSTTLTHCTLTGNTAGSTGGGIHNYNGRTTLIHCTLASNTAPAGEGSGVASYGDSATITEVQNCIISGNTGSSVDYFGNITNSFLSRGSNLIGSGNATAAFTQAGDILNDTPNLFPPGNHGGSVQTMPPRPGSPAMDSALHIAGLLRDQNGRLRGSALWSNDFASQLNGATALGAAVLSNGSLRLTPNANSQAGTLILPDLGSLSSFTASFDYSFTTGNGDPADGISFNFGPAPAGFADENGINPGHSVSFNIYNNAAATYGVIRYIRNGVTIVQNTTALQRFGDAGPFRPVFITLAADGSLTVSYKGAIVLGPVATGYTYAAGHRLSFGARTGGGTSEQRIDNFGVLTQPAGLPDIGAVEGFQKVNPVVNSWGDTEDLKNDLSTDYSLREALKFAAPGSTITFAGVNGRTLQLGSELTLSRNVTVDATSLPNGFIIDGGTGRRHFVVASGVTAELKGLTLRNGYSPGGGSIYNDHGTLILRRCTLAGNISDGPGGALHNQGTAELYQCTLSGNIANKYSAVAAEAMGGAIYNEGPLKLTRCTVTNNDLGNAAFRLGGGIYNSGKSVTLENTIVAGNSASTTGHNIYNYGNFGVIAPTGRNIVETGPGGLVHAAGGYIAGGSAGSLITGTLPMFAPLDNYGGATPTHALLPGTNARDNGIISIHILNGVTTDQRDFPFVGAPDLGAYEAGTRDRNFNAYIWETLPVAVTLAQRAASFDYDNDGQTNLDEFKYQTSAANSASMFTLSSATGGGGLQISFLSASGREYFLTESTNLSTWTAAPNAIITGDGTVKSFTVPQTAARRFYQVIPIVP